MKEIYYTGIIFNNQESKWLRNKIIVFFIGRENCVLWMPVNREMLKGKWQLGKLSEMKIVNCPNWANYVEKGL